MSKKSTQSINIEKSKNKNLDISIANKLFQSESINVEKEAMLNFQVDSFIISNDTSSEGKILVYLFFY